MQSSGATLIAISPQLERYNLETGKRHLLTFDLLTDRGNRVATEFGLTHKLPDDLRTLYTKFGADLARFNGDDSWTLPMPARFVISQEATVYWVSADPDYTIRPEPAETIECLKRLTEQ
jgi:peroxiredoxin